jgi:hypothetical protein
MAEGGGHGVHDLTWPDRDQLGHDDVAGCGGELGDELGHQPGLADPAGAEDRDESGSLDRPGQRSELVDATDQP